MARQSGWLLMVLIVTGLSGCKNDSTGKDVPLYRIETSLSSVAVGAHGETLLRFVPADGYHWNDEFPAKVRLSETVGVVADRTEFSSGGGDFRVENGTGLLPIALAGKDFGTGRVKTLADFSMCNQKECRIFKGIATEINVEVR